MSTKISNDLQVTEEFLRHLSQFDHLLFQEFNSLNNHWRSIGSAWNDDKYAQFGQLLEETLPGIAHYLASAKGYEEYLKGLIADLATYLSHKR